MLLKVLRIKDCYGHTPIFYIKDPKIIEIYKNALDDRAPEVF